MSEKISYYQQNKEKYHQYYLSRKKVYQDKYEQNKDAIIKRSKQYYLDHRDECLARSKKQNEMKKLNQK